MGRKNKILLAMLPFTLLFSSCGLKKDYDHLVMGFWQKFNALVDADRENETIKETLVQLQAENLQLKTEIAEYEEKEKARRIRSLALKEGGDQNARVVEGLLPEVYSKEGRQPSSLKGMDKSGIFSGPTDEIYDLSLSSFKKGAYEKAARGLLSLQNGHEKNKYSNPEVNYFLGVSFYQLKNFKQALHAFDAGLKNAPVHYTLAHKNMANMAPKLFLWKSLTLRKLGQENEARKTVQRLIEDYPNSVEARRFH